MLVFVLAGWCFCLPGVFGSLCLADRCRIFYGLVFSFFFRRVGVFAFLQAGLLFSAAVVFRWLGVVLGGYLFGLWVFLACGFAAWPWYGVGDGLLGCWFALFSFLVLSAVVCFLHARGFDRGLWHYPG
ncbi:YeeE/YedE thiosulfate transporter family protein [Escherichia coli]|uniref:YeeE/YedE thiosulfate transporter family protein n=1 Tax=Escherichia coli TaxID=562 RepID=UPI003D803D29